MSSARESVSEVIERTAAAFRPVSFWQRGTVKVIGSGELVDIVDWNRPYGIPYATTSDGREFHQSQLETV